MISAWPLGQGQVVRWGQRKLAASVHQKREVVCVVVSIAGKHVERATTKRLHHLCAVFGECGQTLPAAIMIDALRLINWTLRILKVPT